MADPQSFARCSRRAHGAAAALQVQSYVDEVCDRSVEALRGVSDNFKYVVTCFIAENKGAAWHTANSGYADPDADGARAGREGGGR